MSESPAPRRSPLDSSHQEAGGRMVEFAGWWLPVQYSGLVEEHRAVRGAAGLFDVSHMGEIRVSGAGAEDWVQSLTPNDVGRLAIGQAHYSALLTREGTYLDDLLVYKLAADRLMLVVNAANARRDFEEVVAGAPEGVEVVDISDQYALLALQGPRALEILAPLGSASLGELGYYRFLEGEVAGVPALVSRTGYTGEDGFELYLPPARAPEVWDQLLAAGGGHGLLPAGLGARDTLRLEAGMALYGHEIDRETTPWEAGLGWTVKLDAGPFRGREALIRKKEEGVDRKLAGFELQGRGPVPRQGQTLLAGDEPVGRVTSGTWSPTFEKGLGMAYVPVEHAKPGAELELEVRGRRVPVVICRLPFYRRPS